MSTTPLTATNTDYTITDDEIPHSFKQGMAEIDLIARAQKAEAELAAAKKRIADCEFVMAHRYDIIERQEPRCNEANARAEKAEKLWKEFIDLLEITEESDSGNRFRPNYIGSCRALDGQRMNQIIKEARGMVFDAPKE